MFLLEKMKDLVNTIKQKFKQGDMHIKLLIVNISLFIFCLLVSILIKFSSPDFNLANYYAASSNPVNLLYKPWTLVTHMFTHDISGIGHILWNMVMLFFIGDFFVRALGNKKMLSIYLAGGFAGYLLFAFGYNFLPAFSSLGEGMVMGASAAITAIMVSLVTYRPNLQLKFVFLQNPVKLVYIVGLFVVLDLIRLQTSIGIAGSNAGGWLAHLGGALFGFVHATQLKKGKNWLGGFERFLDNLFSGSLFSFKIKKPKLEVKKGGKYKKNETPKPKEKNLNIEPILEKVKKSGYSSLTQKEKEIFFSQSK